VTSSRLDRPGTSLLEIQVALIVLAIAVAGLCPLVVMQAKLLRGIENLGPNHNPNPQLIRGVRIIDGLPFDGATHQQPAPPLTVLLPQPDAWVRRLGVAASFRPDIPTASYTLRPVAAKTDDDSDSDFSAPGWSTSSDATALGGSYHWVASVTATSPATWSFYPLPPGRYAVFVSYVPGPLNATDATYSFNSAGQPVSLPVNQKVAPSGINDLPPYKSLGEFYLAAPDPAPSPFQLTLNPGPLMTGRVVADTVLLVPVPPNAVTILPPKTITDSSITATVQVTTAGPGP
jgi:hypothetical protein